MNNNKAIAELTAKLLEMASDVFDNHGCNDMELENTPENYALVQAALTWNNDPHNQEVHVSEDGSEIFTSDSFMMGFLAAHYKKEANK